MNLPVETKPALWGIAGGAIALAIIGFTWGGWVTGARSTADATQRANTAVVAALAPVCVERFKGATEVSANLAALKLVDSWSQGAYVEKGGWAALPGLELARTVVRSGEGLRRVAHRGVIGRDPRSTRCPRGRLSATSFAGRDSPLVFVGDWVRTVNETVGCRGASIGLDGDQWTHRPGT